MTDLIYFYRMAYEKLKCSKCDEPALLLGKDKMWQSWQKFCMEHATEYYVKRSQRT